MYLTQKEQDAVEFYSDDMLIVARDLQTDADKYANTLTKIERLEDIIQGAVTELTYLVNSEEFILLHETYGTPF